MFRCTWMIGVAAAACLTHAALAQSGGAPRNDLPQPYRTTRDWGGLPPGMKWPAVTAIEAAPDGTIYVVARCFNNSCTDRPEPAILKYGADGTLLGTWGQGMFNFPHGATVDRDGNLWVTDARGAGGRGHQVFKFDPSGRVLMTLGTAGVSGAGSDLFDQPTDVGRQEQPRGQVHEGRQVREGMGAKRIRAWRDQRTAHDCDGLARTVVRG
ncbi:MAG: hypothetical protein HW381_1402 [Candidatus Rokubacteria bacterium]|nr:hypothetical protein [Candidatus Rokubacteria bacterium]